MIEKKQIIELNKQYSTLKSQETEKQRQLNDITIKGLESQISDYEKLKEAGVNAIKDINDHQKSVVEWNQKIHQSLEPTSGAKAGSGITEQNFDHKMTAALNASANAKTQEDVTKSQKMIEELVAALPNLNIQNKDQANSQLGKMADMLTEQSSQVNKSKINEHQKNLDTIAEKIKSIQVDIDKLTGKANKIQLELDLEKIHAQMESLKKGLHVLGVKATAVDAEEKSSDAQSSEKDSESKVNNVDATTGESLVPNQQTKPEDKGINPQSAQSVQTDNLPDKFIEKVLESSNWDYILNTIIKDKLSSDLGAETHAAGGLVTQEKGIAGKGEFVINKAAASNIGTDVLSKMNNFQIPALPKWQTHYVLSEDGLPKLSSNLLQKSKEVGNKYIVNLDFNQKSYPMITKEGIFKELVTDYRRFQSGYSSKVDFGDFLQKKYNSY
ncbi:MAG: hypothetical protein HQK91_05555 [Nitrospirae bacterium]|nr:hypothetical protein [Nitrospirota bacterium]